MAKRKMKAKDTPEATPVPPQQPQLQMPQLTVGELKSLLGEKDIVILQMTKLVENMRAGVTALSQKLAECEEQNKK